MKVANFFRLLSLSSAYKTSNVDPRFFSNFKQILYQHAPKFILDPLATFYLSYAGSIFCFRQGTIVYAEKRFRILICPSPPSTVHVTQWRNMKGDGPFLPLALLFRIYCHHAHNGRHRVLQALFTLCGFGKRTRESYTTCS